MTLSQRYTMALTPAPLFSCVSRSTHLSLSPFFLFLSSLFWLFCPAAIAPRSLGWLSRGMTIRAVFVFSTLANWKCFQIFCWQLFHSQFRFHSKSLHLLHVCRHIPPFNILEIDRFRFYLPAG